MSDLIACLNSSKNGWAHVKKLINDESWNQIFLICDQHPTDFSVDNEISYIIADPSLPIQEYIEVLKKNLNDKLSFGEVGINLVSGSGKEHMGIISAIIKIGVGFHLIAATKDGIKEL